MPPSTEPTPSPKSDPVRLTSQQARPHVKMTDVLVCLKRARHCLIYTAQHYLVIDALIFALSQGNSRHLSRYELLTMYRAIGYVHIACNSLHPNAPVPSSLDAVEHAISYCNLQVKLRAVIATNKELAKNEV